MNMDYSKAFELLNQDAENERNKKAEKAVHDNLYNKGFRDGIAILDKIRAEIEQDAFKDVNGSKYIFVNRVNQIIDKYRAESEVKE